ncbi:hypothetical protein ACS0TY_004624 [Phlomoides rotata]
MVVCKCRKVRTYSEWVIDGEYDWPPKCCQCQVVLEEGADTQVTRLGCLHLIHSSCLLSHIKSFSPAYCSCGICLPSLFNFGMFCSLSWYAIALNSSIETFSGRRG